MGEAHKGHDLSGVKAVLEKLQRLDLDAADTLGPAGLEQTGSLSGQAAPANSSLPADLSVFDRKRAAIAAAKGHAGAQPRRAAYLSGAAALIAAALLAASIVGVPAGLKIGLRKAEPAGVTQHRENETMIAQARRFLSEGNVALARGQLLGADPERRAEVAFMLAQSYDPNYLASLQNTNGALADRFEAERWYKKWHELAVQSGLELDSRRLQRIINAMR